MQQSLSTVNVFLLEPSASQNRLIQRQLSELGIALVQAFTTPHEVLEQLQSQIPDVLICAMHMEEMTGRDLVLKLRENPATEELGFILVSSETRFSELNPVRQAGAAAVLPKPFKTRDLEHALHTVMDWRHQDRLDLEDFEIENLRFLVIDDSDFARHLITRTLRQLGAENLDEASNGKEAIPLIEKNFYDLIFSDYHMPELDGYELLEYIRNESSQPSVPVLMVTTEGNQSSLAAIQHAGVTAIFDKPFEVSMVREQIQKALSEQ